MPTWFPSYTNCSAPSAWYKVPVWAMVLLGGIGIGGLIAAGAASAWAPGVAVFLAMACLAGITFCTWWLNVRLICLGGDRSAIGAIYHLEPPNPSLDAFALGDYDTDYSFNLLLWPFVPQDELPASFVSDQWSASAEGQLASDWPTLPPLVPSVPWATVQAQVEHIIPQQTMASLGLTFVGQDVEAADEPSPAPAAGTSQHFLLHCEIEGAGIYDLRTLLWVLFGVFVVAAAVYAIPVIGPILSWILSILAFLAFLFGGPALQHDDASPPTGGGWGGSFNPYDGAASGDSVVDLAYVFGRWVYDSLHDGWNELHPLHYMIKIGQAKQGDLAAGNWPPGLGGKQQRYEAQFAANNTPAAAATQAEPQNQWTLHPLLDGCGSAANYPGPPGDVIE
jgi:hypothetical protein